MSTEAGGYHFFVPEAPPHFSESSLLRKRSLGAVKVVALFDTKQMLAESLRIDWAWACKNKIDMFIARHDISSKDGDAAAAAAAVARVYSVLERHYGMVLSVFEYFASFALSSGSLEVDLFTISMNEYLAFLDQCHLGVVGSLECEKAHLEQLFIAVDSGQKIKEDFNSKRALSRQEFLQVLVQIAVRRYVRPRKAGARPIHMSVADALLALLSEHLPPYLDAAALQVSNEFRNAYLYVSETDATLGFHEQTLRNVFDVYADTTHASATALASASLLGFDEYLTMCHHLEIIDHDFTMREATLCFLWSKLRVANESDAKERRKMTNLRFEDFLEAIVRIATMKCVPTDEEVEEGGFDDGGQMLLALRRVPAHDRAFRASRPAEWNMPLRQPIWRCVHHLISFFVHVIEEQVHGSGAGGDLVLSRREVCTFKEHHSHKGIDERGQEDADSKPKRGISHHLDRQATKHNLSTIGPSTAQSSRQDRQRKPAY